jgi:hypothetical protein
VAFQADCLPSGPDGLPKEDPTRDTLIFGWSGTLSGIIVPLVGGAILNIGWRKQLMYHYIMFIWAVILGSIVAAIFASIPTQNTHGLTSAAARSILPYRPPLGAKLCDGLCCHCGTKLWAPFNEGHVRIDLLLPPTRC